MLKMKSKCNEEKTSNRFQFRKDRGHYATVCKDCRNVYEKIITLIILKQRLKDKTIERYGIGKIEKNEMNINKIKFTTM